MRKILVATLSSAALLTAAGTALADTQTSFINVSATVLKNCAVTSNPLAFGNYTPNSGALTGNTTIKVNCTKGSAFTVSLNAGTTTGGTVAQRLMTDGTNTLQYNLYKDAGLSTIFGDGSGGSATQTDNGKGMSPASAWSYTVYGSLPDSATNQDAPPGSYTDKITVTVSY